MNASRATTQPTVRAAAIPLAGAAVATLALIAGRLTWLAVVLVLTVLATAQAFGIARRRDAAPLPIVGFVAAGACAAIAYDGPETLLAGIPGIAAAIVAFTLILLVLRGRLDGAVASVSFTVAVATTIAIPASFAVALRSTVFGFRVALAYLIMAAVAEITVTAAKGRRPIAKAIGSSRTWEGALAAAVAALLAGALVAATMNPPFDVTRATLLAIVVTVGVVVGGLAGDAARFEAAPAAAPTDAGHEQPRRARALDVLGPAAGPILAAPLFYFAYRAMVR